MAEIWTLCDARAGELRPSSLELIGAARSLGDDNRVTSVLIGSGVAGLADQLSGADAVLAIDDERLERYSPDGWARILAGLVSERAPDVVLASATARGRDLAPRVAAILGVDIASDAVEISLDAGRLNCVRPIYAGKALARVRVSDDPQLVTVRPNSYPAAGGGSGAPAVELVTPGDDYRAGAEVVEVEQSSSERPDVAEADVIVSGGRGMGGPEHFALLEDLADALGAAVGASRAVVDAGWRPHGEQVGQTGKTVSPSLYIACGISGAVQHLAGMKTAKTIVAINKDPEAPIFSVADYGIVGDVFEVLPELTAAVRAQRGG